MPEQLQKIIDNLSAFGARRLIVMGGVAAAVMAIVTVAALYLNRPAYETLYVGLERADVNQIGLVLGEAGISFDVASDGTTVLVPVGKTAQARMLLAEKGLPTSTNAGYELFDNVGSLGLTSFMQQVTRVRALEGEIRIRRHPRRLRTGRARRRRHPPYGRRRRSRAGIRRRHGA